ncbi:hypothetical protein K2Z83_02720 [Oscillochloris sp. ZM17-4]|uniref:hypothetical protein n=1 Tax=Oscillochloris sp. ZM17-4 TaxID=2866714 RepID=UPI001C72AD43|nr:hypothetical protein [Oscillochloris sp. ZM17-4]MBX0326604.1 hypothetical protein [Oscillochloris sp. ZM17-4]
MLAEEEAHRHDAARRDAWWGRAREAAALLRARFGAKRIVVLGDLVRPTPLHFWSELTLVVAGLSDYSYDMYMALRELEREPKIEVRRIEELSPRQAAMLMLEGREIS